LDLIPKADRSLGVSRQPLFGFVLSRRTRGRWDWRVYDDSGLTLMVGRGTSRAAARYQAERALFLLLISAARRRP
jgi:hypothetical protein